MLPHHYKILIVDDEPDFLEILGYNLEKEGFQVFTAFNGMEAIEKAREIKPHLIILDVTMPEMDGIEACERIRQLPDMNNTLIAFFSARGEDYSQIAGLEAGADDYISKLIKPKVFISKIKALLRRLEIKGDRSPDKIAEEEKNRLIIDKDRYLALKDGNEIIMPRKEFELLLMLSSKPGKVFTREEIFGKLWGDDVIVGERTIDVHIRKLREKIGENKIKTVKGVGYKYFE